MNKTGLELQNTIIEVSQYFVNLNRKIIKFIKKLLYFLSKLFILLFLLFLSMSKMELIVNNQRPKLATYLFFAGLYPSSSFNYRRLGISTSTLECSLDVLEGNEKRLFALTASSG